MKPFLLPVLFLLLASPLFADAQQLDGVWAGTLHGQKDSRIVLRIRPAEIRGSYRGVAYVDNRGMDIPIDLVGSEGDHVSLSIGMLGVHFNAFLSTDGSAMTGEWTGSGAQHPLELHRTTEEQAWTTDTSSHRITHVTVDNDIEVEVLDWGGTGSAVVLLAGLGNNAHVFDTFAPKLAQTFHVYGITRRGLGASSYPPPTAENYAANRLGDDVFAVITSLRLDHPLLIGHSIAGSELSSVGTRHPEAIRGLVYLDAAYAYAFYDEKHPDANIALNGFRDRLAAIRIAVPPPQQAEAIKRFLELDTAQLRNVLEVRLKEIEALPKMPVEAGPPPSFNSLEAIVNGEQKFLGPQCPVLAIFALEGDRARIEQQATAVAANAPQAKIVKLSPAKHYVFLTNEADVLREINSFASSLK